jgi:succinate dehydrogenase/fumarate reductase flavoprotein subunit
MGFDEKEAAKLKPWLPKKWGFETDVVVMGYGEAGICAAITVHDAGAKVLILEKAPVSGGNTTTAAGVIRIPTNVPDAIEYYKALTQGAVDEKD